VCWLEFSFPKNIACPIIFLAVMIYFSLGKRGVSVCWLEFSFPKNIACPIILCAVTGKFFI
jgi:hypothetical protein